MTQSKINKAYPAIMRIFKFRLPVKKSKLIFQLAAAMESHYKFAVSEEQKYIAEFGGEVNCNGVVKFSNPDKVSDFQKCLDELNSIDVPLEFEPITISESDLAGERISPADVASLDGIIDFI